MRYFIRLLSSLLKSVMVMVPLSLLWALSCPSEKKESESFHPVWCEVNGAEDKLDKDKCTITKCGLNRLRFHVTDGQQCFNSKDFCSKPKKNIVEIDSKAVSWVLTPNFYGSVTKEKFSKTMEIGMKYQFDKYKNKNEEGGIPLPFLEEWLAIDPIDYKEVILIIATGIEGYLGVSEPLKKALRDKKEKGEIRGYEILKTKGAIIRHNWYVQEGNKVFTFIHTAG